MLSFTQPITLAEDLTATVFCMRLFRDEGDDGVVRWLDGLRGPGSPVPNRPTVAGETNLFACCQAAHIRFAKPRVSDFIRCGPDCDLTSNLADAVRTVNELFRGGPPTACPAAADCNADGMEDLGDALYAIE